MNGIKVCSLTSSHNALDERIFHKEAKSLERAGYCITVIAPHAGDDVVDGIRIKAVQKSGSRFERLLVTPIRVLMAGIRERAAIYHIHDPELIPAGLVLRLLGGKVIYDVEEYYRLKIKAKTWIPGWLRGFAAAAFDLGESLASRFFEVIVVDRVTAGKFGGDVVQVSNYPYTPQGSGMPEMPADGLFRCVYAGGLLEERGLFKMVEAMGYAGDEIRLVLLGRYQEADRKKASGLKGYEKVDWLGFRPWPEVIKLLPGYDLGLVLLQPTPAYLYAGENTVKLFEYMMSGLPVLASDFPNLKRIIDQEGCGLVVDPSDPREIARKIMYFADNRDAGRKMGEKGRKAFADKYNWEKEEEKLLELYGRVLGERLPVGGRKAAA